MVTDITTEQNAVANNYTPHLKIQAATPTTEPPLPFLSSLCSLLFALYSVLSFRFVFAQKMFKFALK